MSRRAIAISVLVILLVTLPFVYAQWAAGEEYVFGGALLNPQDVNSYLAKMYQGWRGDPGFTLPYTAEPGQSSYLFLFYLFLGRVAKLSGLEQVVVFHLARLVGAAILLVILFYFFKTCLPDRSQVNLAFALAALGSGLGWVVVVFGGFTTDFWVAEAYPFLSSYANPHFALGLALVLALLIPYAREATRRSVLWELLRPAAAALLLASFSPFGVVIALVVAGGVTTWGLVTTPRYGWNERLGPELARWVGIGLGGLPLLLYDAWVTRVQPALAGWNAQNLTSSPPLWDLVLSFSPVLWLAIPGAWVAWKRSGRGDRLLLIWAVAGLVLTLIPFSLQRRFLMGLYVPLAGLAVIGMGALAARLPRAKSLLVAAIFLLALPTNLVVLLAGIHGAQTHDHLLYLTRGEAGAMEWIQKNTPERALILAAPETGLFIPAHTGRRVLYGHPFETVNAAVEKATVTRFFSPMETSAEAAGILQRRQVSYVFYGPREQQLGPIPAWTPLQVVYSRAGVALLAVSPLP